MKFALTLALAIGAAFSMPAQAAETVRYVLLVEGDKKAGEQVVEHRDDGVTRVHYIFKDNGRGPELDEEYTLRPDGTFATYNVTGTTTFGAKVDERYRRDGGQFRVAEMDIPDDATAARYNRNYEKMIEFAGRLHRAGITIVGGTDALPGFTLHRELELYVEAGMTPGEALQSATSVAARIARVDADRGDIAAGKPADLILVDGDPTTDISAIRNVALVLTQGRVVSPNAVYTELGIKPFVANAPAVTPTPTPAASKSP